MLKRYRTLFLMFFYFPAAFRRLCVETFSVEDASGNDTPAAFRRLCVETPHWLLTAHRSMPSRLQAAVC